MGNSLLTLESILDKSSNCLLDIGIIVTIEGLGVGLPMTYRYIQKDGKEIHGVKQSDEVEKIEDCGGFRNVYTETSVYHFKYI